MYVCISINNGNHLRVSAYYCASWENSCSYLLARFMLIVSDYGVYSYCSMHRFRVCV